MLVKVIDADTVHVLCLTHAAAVGYTHTAPVEANKDTCTLLKVRIKDIDAPEMSKAFRVNSVNRIWLDPARVQHRAGVRARWFATLYLGSAGVLPHPVYDDPAWQSKVWPDAAAHRAAALLDARHTEMDECPMVRITWPSKSKDDAGPSLDAYGRSVADVFAWAGWDAANQERVSLSQDALRKAYAKPYKPGSGVPRAWTEAECSVYPFTSTAPERVFLDDSVYGSA